MPTNVLDAQRNRTVIFFGRFRTLVNAPAGLDDDDELRVKVGLSPEEHPDDSPAIELISGTATPYGSNVSIVSREADAEDVNFIIKLDEHDTAALPAVDHFLEVLWVDSNDAYRTKQLAKYILRVADTQRGPIGA